jgi:hypothetical protein
VKEELDEEKRKHTTLNEKFDEEKRKNNTLKEKFDEKKWMKALMNYRNYRSLERTHLYLLIEHNAVPTKSIELFLNMLEKYYEKDKMLDYILKLNSEKKLWLGNCKNINLLLSKLMQYCDGDKNILFRQFLIKSDDDDKTALHHTVENGRNDFVNLFLQQFDETKNQTDLMKYLKMKDKNGNTALHFCQKGDIVQSLLNKIDAEEDLMDLLMAQNTHGDTLLHLSI